MAEDTGRDATETDEELDGALADDPDETLDPYEEEHGEGAGLPTWLLTAVGTALLIGVAVVVVAVILMSGDDDEDSAPTVVADDFDRGNAEGLGSADGGTWEEVTGSWGVSDGQARVIEPSSEGPRNVAVVEMGSPDGAVEATATRLTPGWGLVFRYRGPFNYWMVTAAPDSATYNLARVVDGEFESLGGIGLASIDDGTVVRIEFSGSTITVFVNGNRTRSITDTNLAEATMVGLVGAGELAPDARWDDFRAEASGDAQDPSTPVPPPSEGTTSAVAPTAPTTTPG